MMMDPLRHVYSAGLSALEAFRKLAEALERLRETRVSKHRKAREKRLWAKKRNKWQEALQTQS